MSTNQHNQTKNEEEVDLGSLFVIIGKGFSKFFNFIGSIFKGVFHTFIIVLLFIKTNIIAIGIAAVIGLIIGVFLEVKSSDKYASDMLVQPNFKSARQLYTNIQYYNDLVKQKDTVLLKNVFGITKLEAASLKKFTIEPIATENDIISAYDEFVIEVDTTTIKSYEYENYKTSFSDYDYKLHNINIIAEKNNIFTTVGDVIITSVVKNKFFDRAKSLENEFLNRSDSLLKSNLSQVDSLRKVYMKVLLEEAKKQSNGTNIDLGGQKNSTKEIELFETNRKINEDLKDIVEDKSEKYEVVNVISNFQPIGYKVEGVSKNKAFLLSVLFIGITILFLLLKQLNAYLNNYNKK